MKPIGTRLLSSLLLLLLTFTAGTLFSQNHTLSGKVTDEENRLIAIFTSSGYRKQEIKLDGVTL